MPGHRGQCVVFPPANRLVEGWGFDAVGEHRVDDDVRCGDPDVGEFPVGARQFLQR